MLALIDNFRDLEGRVRDTSNAMESRFRERRQLLPRERDWLTTLRALALHPEHAGDVAAYENALRQRARLLGEGNRDPHWFTALEDTMARHGVALAAARADTVQRLDAAARRGPEVAGILTAAGLAPERILFCNIDKVLDLAYVADVVDTGAVVEFAFGSDHSFGGGIRDHTDRERLDFLGSLVDARPDAAITLSCSVWTKGQLTRYGGMGYGHVLARIAPLLAGVGVDDARLTDMLIARPVALLDRMETPG